LIDQGAFGRTSPSLDFLPKRNICIPRKRLSVCSFYPA
jgi:hypothetical protein